MGDFASDFFADDLSDIYEEFGETVNPVTYVPPPTSGAPSAPVSPCIVERVTELDVGEHAEISSEDVFVAFPESLGLSVEPGGSFMHGNREYRVLGLRPHDNVGETQYYCKVK